MGAGQSALRKKSSGRGLQGAQGRQSRDFTVPCKARDGFSPWAWRQECTCFYNPPIRGALQRPQHRRGVRLGVI